MRRDVVGAAVTPQTTERHTSQQEVEEQLSRDDDRVPAPVAKDHEREIAASSTDYNLCAIASANTRLRQLLSGTCRLSLTQRDGDV